MLTVDRERFGLPRLLDDELLLRWATPADTEELVEFNFRLHNDSPAGRPELWLKDWTRELMGNNHPTTGPGDFAVIVDQTQNCKIVSASVLISQTWSYDGLPFACGRPELIATDEAYRRRGLVRAQFEALHARSSARDELVQAITGIPWYYRQFGYEMTLDLGGSRAIALSNIADHTGARDEAFRLRPADTHDLPDLARLYEIHCGPSLIHCERDEAAWRYELNNAQTTETPLRNREMIETLDGEVAGYAEIICFPRTDRVRELAVYENFSLRDVSIFIARALKGRLQRQNPEDEQRAAEITFALGRSHPAYDALATELGNPQSPYAWYIRVENIPKFLAHIRTVLEKRLQKSAKAGFSGSLRLNFYRQQYALTFQDGKLELIDSYHPEQFLDGDAYFPGMSFLQLLFGYRAMDELKYAYADCFTNKPEIEDLLKVLFPKQPSHVSMLS